MAMRAAAAVPSSPGAAALSPQHQPETDPVLMNALNSCDLVKLRRFLSLKGLYTEVLSRKTIGDLAAERGNADVLQMLREMSFDFDRRNRDCMVPFHYAMKKRQLSTMRQLRSLGASPDLPLPTVSGKGVSDTPLHVACATLDRKLLQTLLDQCGANLNVVDAQGNTPLHRACLEDSLLAVQMLVPHLTEQVLNMQGHEGKTALHIAVLNQNREIVRLLMTTKGSLVDVPAANGKTVIDILMEINSRSILHDFVYYYTVSKLKDLQASTFKDLSHKQQFEQYLEFLSNIDNEFKECTMELKSISITEKDAFCTKLQDDDNIDLIEFKEVIMQLLQTEDIHDLIQDQDSNVLTKIVENIVHYVLFREDAVLLEKIMYCGVLWSRVSKLIEDHIDTLYVQVPEREVNGIVQHFKSRFVEGEAVRHDNLSKYYGEQLSCYKLQPYWLDTNPNTLFMRHPMNTLPVWSVLSGRLSLTELLLRQEKFDVVPLSLFCAALLRTFPKNQELVVEEDEIEDLALTCERFARKVVEKVNSIDTSYNRSVSVDYLLRPLESYGGVSCVKLAASNECAAFLQSELCQRALDKMWFRSLLHMNVFLREFIIWMGAIPFNFFVPLILLYFDETEMRTRRRHEERSFVSEDQSSQKFSKFHLLTASLPVKSHSADSIDGAARRRGSSNHSLGAMASERGWQAQRSQESVNRKQTEKVELRPLGRPLSKTSEKSDASSLLNKHNEPEVESVLSSIRTRALRRFCRFFELITEFYSIPAVKFRYHIAAHILLVCLLSYLLLMDFEYKIKEIEIVVYAILSGMLLEEIGEFAQYYEHNDIRSYFRSKWNLIDITALSCGVVGFVIRMCEMKYSTEWGPMLRDFEDRAWYTARVALSICCTLYWIRLLYISTVLKNLGPKLKMIAKMITKDLLPFLLILFIFILGFGVLMHSLLYPNGFRAWNHGQLNKVHVLLNMLKICFYSMVGEYSLDTIMGDESCEQIYANRENNTNNCPHHFGRYLVPYLILPLYVIVTEILLLNLIIAMFSKTIEAIDSRSRGLWQFERYDLIEEFEARSSLPPPLNVIDLVRKLVLLIRRYCRRICCQSCCRCRTKQLGAFGQKLVMQYLLFQAFSLRNSREEMMRQCLPKQETETEEMLMKVREIVEDEVSKLLTVSYEDSPEGVYDATQPDQADMRESIATNTLLEATPPPPTPPPSASRRAGTSAAAVVQAPQPNFPTDTRSLDCLATGDAAGGVAAKRRVFLRELK